MGSRKKTTAERIEKFLLQVMENADEKIENRISAAAQLRLICAAKKGENGEEWRMNWS